MRASLAAVVAILALVACNPTKDTPVDSGTDTGDSGHDSGQIDTATCQDMDNELGQPDAPGCAGAGGVCVSDQAACADGTLQSAFDGECTFSDGPGYCCVPPPPAASGSTCAASGGVCAPIGGCGATQGWYTPNGDECSAAYGVGSICCAPHDACEGWGVVACCSDDGATAFVADCDFGTLSCPLDGTNLTCDQDCPAFTN